MVRLTANNNATVSFGPIENNRSFRVILAARPEAVDEITNTALPVVDHTVRYSANLVAIEALPRCVWLAPTTASSNRSLYRAAGDMALPPGHVSNQHFYCLYDLSAIAHEMRTPFDAGAIEAISFDELLALPGGESIALKLLHELIFEHLRSKGLSIDYGRRRAFFPLGDEHEVKVSYQGRVRRATRTVVKARTRRDTGAVAYYEHKAVAFSVMRFGSTWALVLTPGYVFTRDGLRRPLSREKTNSLSTRRAARDFNPNVLHDVSFWIAYLSDEADGLFPLEHEEGHPFARFGPSVLLSHRLPSTSINVSAFEETEEYESEIDEELRQLEAELEELARSPDDDGDDDEGDPPDEGERDLQDDVD
jgi:hypothetical protein